MNIEKNTIAYWKTHPTDAFEKFVRSSDFQAHGRRQSSSTLLTKPMRDSSAKVYMLMFGKFLRWTLEKKLCYLELSGAEIIDFIEYESGTSSAERTKDLISSIRIRYLRILERVFQHLEIVPNPAQHAIFNIYTSKNKSLRGKDAGKAVLTEAEQEAFMHALPVSVCTMESDSKAGLAGWKRRRDRAMQAMMLGGGLKVSEVIGIGTVNVGTLDSQGCIPVTVSPSSTEGTSRWHETLVRQFAVREIIDWYDERMKIGIPGPLFFPATMEGKKLDKATVYRQVKATFERANISTIRLGGRTLRNSFAVRELKQGVAIEEVGEFMGHRKRKSTEHYLLEYPAKSEKK